MTEAVRLGRELPAETYDVALFTTGIIGAKDRFPGPAFFGLGPGLVKTGIRANYLGEGSTTHTLSETAIGILAQSPESYARRVVPILFAPELEGRTGLMFDSRTRREMPHGGDQPILPTQGLDKSYVDRYLTASEALLRRALNRP